MSGSNTINPHGLKTFDAQITGATTKQLFGVSAKGWYVDKLDVNIGNNDGIIVFQSGGESGAAKIFFRTLDKTGNIHRNWNTHVLKLPAGDSIQCITSDAATDIFVNAEVYESDS